jgi:putative transposase
MKRKFTESLIVDAIKKQENGIAVKDICRELSIRDATFYNWKAKYGAWKPQMLNGLKNWKQGMLNS